MDDRAEPFSITKILRWAAILGTCLTAAGKVLWVEPLQQNQYFSFYAIGFLAVAVCIALAILPGTRSVLRNSDLLVPLGLYITVNGILDVASRASFFVGFRGGKLDLEGLSVTLVAVWIFRIAATVIFLGWTTKVILHFVESDEVDLLRSFREIHRWFPRTLGVLIFGLIPFFLLMGLISLPLVVGGDSWSDAFFFYPFIGLIAVVSLIWNLATAVLLPYVLSTEIGLERAIYEGVTISWMNKLKTAFPVVLMMVISGWIVFLTVQYTEQSEMDFGKSTDSVSNKANTNLSTNFVWVGDYPEGAKWYPTLMQMVGRGEVPSIGFRIKLLMLLLSLVVNLTIIGAVLKPEAPVTEIVDLGHGSTVGIAVFAMLLVFLVPFEYVISRSGEIFGGTASIVEAPKVYLGERAFTKSELFKYQESTGPDLTPIITSAGSPSGETGNEAGPLPLRAGWISAVYAGEVDDEPGLDVLAAGDTLAFVLTPDGRIKKTIDYNLGGYLDGDTRQSYNMTYIEIADLDGDGKPELAGYGSRLCQIRDLSGKVLWSYKREGEKEYWSVDGLKVADIDNDGKKEILVTEGNVLEVYSRDGRLKWKKIVPGFVPITVSVANRGGKSEVIAGRTTLDAKGESAEKAEIPFITYGYVTGENGSKYALFFDNNKLGVFDSGRLIAKGDAPLSDIPGMSSSGGGEYDFGADRGTSVFKADGLYIRFGSDGRKYLAILAWAASSSRLFLQMLYIYDPDGRLVYHETFDGPSAGISVLPNEDGTENLLLNASGTIYKYSLN